VGALLATQGVAMLSRGMADAPDFYRLDHALLAATVALSVGAALVAGLAPTWRAAGVRPAIQLKSQ
jgi:putative ABC transport system permease protein